MTERIRGRQLQTIRKRFLSAHPLCVMCTAKGQVRAAQEVDHKVPLYLGGEDNDSNRQALCKDCHAAKTRHDMGHKPKLTIGEDGWRS